MAFHPPCLTATGVAIVWAQGAATVLGVLTRGLRQPSKEWAAGGTPSRDETSTLEVMEQDYDCERIPKSFQEQLAKTHGAKFDAACACLRFSAKAMAIQPDNNIQRMVRYLTASITNSLAALGVLCRYGHGVDAIRVARGMFESLVTIKYLLVRPTELKDFLEFD